MIFNQECCNAWKVSHLLVTSKSSNSTVHGVKDYLFTICYNAAHEPFTLMLYNFHTKQRMTKITINRLDILPVIYFLLNGASGQQPVDGDRSWLTNTPRPLSGLCVSARVPVRVKYYNSISTRQVDAKSTDPCCQQEHKQRLILK